MLAMDRVRVARVTTHKAHLQAVPKEVEEMGDTKLFVVDNITAPLMCLMWNNARQAAFVMGCKVGHLLHKLADSKEAVVMLVSNMKGGVEGNLPSLGGICGGLADVRLYAEQVTEEDRVVKVVRGGETV